MGRLALVAFGGNALLRSGQRGTWEEQRANVYEACSALVPLLERGYDLIISHGNGPQVGVGLLQQEAGARLFDLEAMPMDFCGAQTQGSIAYLIETGMDRALCGAGLKRSVVSLVTRVEVSPDDPAFGNPTKPVGPYYPEPPAGDGAVYRQDPRGRGWRKVVPSPRPVAVENVGLAGRLAREGYIVVTAGGGGIPVVRRDGVCEGVEAVIDKDLASALVAVRTGADEFYILTDIPKVYINFRSPGERALDSMTVAEAERYLLEGQFAEGSMAPKVRAGIEFVRATGGKCIITEASQLGSGPVCGTQITV